MCILWNKMMKELFLYSNQKNGFPFYPELCSHTCKFNLCINIRAAQIILYQSHSFFRFSNGGSWGVIVKASWEASCLEQLLGLPEFPKWEVNLTTTKHCPRVRPPCLCTQAVGQRKKEFCCRLLPPVQLYCARDSSWFGPEYCKCCHSNKPVTEVSCLPLK